MRPAWAQSYGLKSLTHPSSGKRIVNGKGVLGDKESEGSRMANLWSDEQKSHIRHILWVRLHSKLKPNNYSRTKDVNVADRWRGRLRSYLGRSHGHGKTEYEPWLK